VGTETLPLISAPEEKVEIKDSVVSEEGRETEEVDGEAQSSTTPETKGPPLQGEQQVREEQLPEAASQNSELEVWKQKVSNLELENRLMKREVNALNEELSGVMQRRNEASDIKAQYESKIQALREQASRAGHVIRQLQSHEEDLQASVVARDSQIEVLRNQLAAGDRALVEAKERLVSSKKEQDR
jgi:chromosome segregation ATPase